MPGLIDYHEQHPFAYELLSRWKRAPRRGGGRGSDVGSLRAQRAYIESIAASLRRAAEAMPSAAPVVIVVNDSHDLYPRILDGAGLAFERRVTRHVNRRTGRRAGEYFEDVLVCRNG